MLNLRIQSPFRSEVGLGVKIILLSVLPLLVLAGLNVAVNVKTDSIFKNTLSSLNKNTNSTAQLLNASNKVSTALVNVIDVFSSLGGAHQVSIFKSDYNNVDYIRVLRKQTPKALIELQKYIEEFGNELKKSNMLDEATSDGAMQSKRFRFIKRTSANLIRLFNLYAVSNERSLEFLKIWRADKAADNFVFEEVSRQNVIQNKLRQASVTVESMLNTVNRLSEERRNRIKLAVLGELDTTTLINFTLLGVVSVLLIIVSYSFATRKISRPLLNMVYAMGRLSKGEVDAEIPEGHRDEIGKMAHALRVFKDNLVENMRMSGERELEHQRVAEAQRQQRNDLAADFENVVGDVVSMVASSSSQLQVTAKNLNDIAEHTEQCADNAMNASTNATMNVQTVASAAEELSHSINEISRQVSESSFMASRAVQRAETTNKTMNELVAAARKIGDVINLITNIADQTNLLALNATIEAARAGEAGKGFAVVASEVKGLAEQTAKATDEISLQVKTIQATTDNAVIAIQEVSSMIDQMNEVSSAIAAAVEEQGASTSEIATNVEAAALGTQDASSDMKEVIQSTERNGQAARDVLSSAEGLSSLATNLREQVDGFLRQVKTD